MRPSTERDDWVGEGLQIKEKLASVSVCPELWILQEAIVLYKLWGDLTTHV